MTILSDYIKKQAELERLQKEISSLETDESLIVEMEFKDRIQALMDEYGKSKKDVISLLDPTPRTEEAGDGRKARRLKKYINPHTNEVVETRGGNHKVIRAWKEEHGKEEVESWVV